LLGHYHDWLDARNPPPPGCFKLHGEYFAVLRTLDVIALALIAVCTTLFGILTPKLPQRVYNSSLSSWLRAQFSRKGEEGREQKAGGGDSHSSGDSQGGR
jgi:hypothetical protein